MAKHGKLKEENEIRCLYFSNNVCDLTSRVMNRNRQNAARELGVNYGWFRKCCSVGLTRPDRRNEAQLKKIADYFHLSVEDLWTPKLLVQIWAGGYLPDVRKLYVSDFHFDEFVKSSKDFRNDIEDAVVKSSKDFLDDIEDARELGILGDHSSESSDDGEERNSMTCQRLRALLQTGQHEYLHLLIDDLFAAKGRLSGDE